MSVLCPICLGSSEKQFVALMCGHVFHDECFSRWSTAERSRPILMIPPVYGKCPVCKQTTAFVHKVYFTADSCQNEDLQRLDEWKKKLADLEEYKNKTSPLLHTLKEANNRLTVSMMELNTSYRLELQSLKSSLQCERASKQNMLALHLKKIKKLDKIIKIKETLIDSLKGEHRSDVEIGDIEVANACIHRLQSDLKQAEKSYQKLTKDLMALNKENSRLKTENLRLIALNSTFSSVNGALKDRLKGSADSESRDMAGDQSISPPEPTPGPSKTMAGEQSISPPEPTPGPSKTGRTEKFVVPTPGPSGVLRAKKSVVPTPCPSGEVNPIIIEISDESDDDTKPVFEKREKATTSGFKILLPKKRRRN